MIEVLRPVVLDFVVPGMVTMSCLVLDPRAG